MSSTTMSTPGTATTGGNPFAIRKFDGSNFMVWKAQIEAYLTLKEALEAVMTVRPAGTIDQTKKQERQELQEIWDLKNNVARAVILLSLNDDQALLVCHLTKAKDIWERLKDVYEHHSQSSRIALQRQFFEAQMKEGEKVVNFASRVQNVYSQLLQAGVHMSEETLVGRIVAGLTSRYHVFMTNWSNGSNLKQTLAELLPRLVAEETLVGRFNKNDSIALIGESSSSRKKSHTTKFSSFKSRDSAKQVDKSKMECRFCGKLGHFISDCFQRKLQQGKGKKKEEVMVAEGIVAESAETSNLSVSNWILDSGASDHMTNDLSSFSSYRASDSAVKVALGDYGSTESLGIGDVMMRADTGERKVFKLENVLYVPGIRRKLVSVGKLDMSGKICPGKIVMQSKSGEDIFDAVLEGNGLYRCLASVETPSSSNVENENGRPDSDIELWHERLAHVNRATIIKMKKLGAVEGIEKYNFPIDAKMSDRRVITCESCCLSKSTHQIPPLSDRPRATVVGQVVHFDICGDINPPSLSGARYFMLFKDEFSNYRTIYFLKSRSEAYDCIRKYVAQVRADTNNKVLCFVSDNGSEFTSNRSQTFFLENGIVHKVTAPYTPQQNGYIERDNRTVMEAVRAMLYHRGLPEFLWGEAANAAVHIINRVLNRVTKTKTPYELYFGRRPRISHLRVFGSIAFMKQPEKKRSGYQRKLEPRSLKMILVGYERDYTYRLYKPDKKEVVISREVVFDEKRMPLQEERPNYDGLSHIIDILSGNDVVHLPDEEAGEANIMTPSHNEEPLTYKEAVECAESARWQTAMKDEYDSLMKNETWSLEKPPQNVRLVRNKWVYKLKKNADGSIARYKARLVAKGFTQRAGIDYQETFSPVVRLESIRLILSIAAREDLELIHFDVKTAFLYGSLSENIWMCQPQGFEINADTHACKLNKSIYGLKQASRVWNSCFTTFLKEFDLTPLKTDSCVFVRGSGNDLLILAIYVDDGLLCCKNKPLIDDIVKRLKQRFDITIMEAECFVGLEISRCREKKTLSISQARYIRGVIDKFELDEAEPAATPMLQNVHYVKDGVADGEISKPVNVPYREAVGSLMYAMTGSRPDLAHAVGIVARFCQDPRLSHWLAVKRILKYLSGTIDLSITYFGESEVWLEGYSDADYAECRETRKSITGFVALAAGGPVYWRSAKQSTVAESTCEAELIACSSLSREIIWLRNFLSEIYCRPIGKPTIINVDNQSAISLIRNNQVHSKIKHIDVRLLAVRERQEEGKIKTVHVRTDEQLADIMTKALPVSKFSLFRSQLMMLVALTLIVSSTTNAYARGFHFEGFSNRNPETHSLTLKMMNPCAIVESAEDQLRGKIELNDESKFNTSLADVTKTLCKSTFDKQVIPAFEAISGCLPAFSSIQRDKRDLTSVAGMAYTAANIVLGVTNLIRGSYGEAAIGTKAETFKALEKDVDASSKISLTDAGSRTIESEREIQIVSESSQSHPEQVREQSATVPMMVWSSFHVANELYAGIANLKAIKMHCLKGRLASTELAEMLELPSLSSILPEDTRLKSITVNSKEREIDFVYELDQGVTVSLKDVTLGIGAFCCIMVVMTLIGVNLHAVMVLSKQGSKRVSAIDLGSIESVSTSRRLRVRDIEM